MFVIIGGVIGADDDGAAHPFFATGLIHIVRHRHIVLLSPVGVFRFLCTREATVNDRIRTGKMGSIGVAIAVQEIGPFDSLHLHSLPVDGLRVEEPQVVALAQGAQHTTGNVS